MTRLHLLSFLCVLAVSSAVAQEHEKVCDSDNPEKCSQPLNKGEVAPFDGQLMTVPLAIDIGQKAMYCDERLRLELDFQKKLTGLDLDLEKRLRKIEQQSFQKQIALLEKRLEESYSRKWYEHPLFIVSVTVVATVLVFYGSTEIVKLVTEK